ncbi:solute symporter family protein [Salininema proteolyticum]|uniref:Cation acetate symporter n=1 Tax=Salininema proteolyticum TaxID=1607685 RepID=A0ABV8TSZ9_9ACTN
MSILAQDVSTTRTLTLTVFILMIAATLTITFMAGRRTKTAADFHSGGRRFAAWQNGFAIGSDYISAASFLGIAGTISLYGYDGFLYSIGFLVAWLIALLVIAEPLRNSGRFTMADVVSFRTKQRPVRTAAAVSTLGVSVFYLLAQMVGAGSLISLLLGLKEGQTFLGMDGQTAANAAIVVVGLLMVLYVTFGGMKGTTWVQIVKACVLMGGAIILAVLVMVHYGFNISALLGDAASSSGQGQAFLEPGLRYGTEVASDAVQTMWNKLDLISLGIALVLGTAGLPHILIRFYTVPDAVTARKSVTWGIGIIGVFYLITLILGFGAAAVVGAEAIREQNPGGNTAAPQLTEVLAGQMLGNTVGAILLAVIAAAAFAAILSTVAGLTIASSSSLAHDLYNSVIKRGTATERQEVRFAKVAAFGVGVIAVVLAIYAQNLNVAFLVGLAFAIAASANLPTLLLSIFWRRFNTSGAVWGIYGGLLSAVVLVVFSSTVSGSPNALLGEDVDFSWFPMTNPALFSVPAGFLFAVLGTFASRESRPDRFAAMQVRAFTGAGAEKAESE